MYHARRLLAGGAQGIQCGQHLAAVRGGLHVGKHARDLALRIDDESVARGQLGHYQVVERAGSVKSGATLPTPGISVAAASRDEIRLIVISISE